MALVALIGPESTGKTTLAKQLAQGWSATFVPELAREYVEQLGRPYTYDDVCEIARRQIAQLQSFDNGLYVLDTELIVTKVWMQEVYQRVPDWMEQAVRCYTADLYLLCYPDLPWIADPVRENGSDEARLYLYHRYEQELQALKKPYYVVRHS